MAKKKKKKKEKKESGHELEADFNIKRKEAALLVRDERGKLAESIMIFCISLFSQFSMRMHYMYWFIM